MIINLTDKNKAEVLAALYNNSQPLGLGALHFDPTPMTTEEAEALLEESTSFDYLKGRVMKVELGGDSFDSWLYDRDNGEGAAERALENLGGNTVEKVGFYYEVSPLAKLAHDGNGNARKAYIKIDLDLEEQPSEEEREMLTGIVKTMVFQQTNIKVEHLKSISKEEYDANHEER